MRRRLPARFWAEVVSAVVCAVALVATLIDREWIEAVFGVEPDGGSGALEWGLVVALACITVGLSLAGRRTWRRAAAVGA